MTHYDADAITRFAHEEEVPGAAEFRRHLEVCPQCAADFEVAQELELELRDKVTWQLMQVSARPVAPPAWLVEREDQRAQERAEVEARLEPLLISPGAFKRASVESAPAFHSAVVVQVLTDAAETLRMSQPMFALSVASAAVAIGTKLVTTGRAISRSTVARAWCQRAIAFGSVGRLRDAEEAARRAQAEFDEDPHSTPHDSAIVWLIRAVSCVETDRISLAEELARDAARVFEHYGDGTRLLNALLIEGTALYVRREYVRGSAVLEKLIAEARARRSSRTLGHALHNAGRCYAEAGDWAKAETYYFEALVCWDELGDETERNRTNWALGSLMLNMGDLAGAIPRFRDSWRRFEALGVLNDAALVKLELAEALLAAGQPEQVPSLLDGVALTFASEGMTQDARLAVAYLTEAVAARGATPQLIPLIHHVRTYLDSLPTAAGRPFAPPN